MKKVLLIAGTLGLLFGAFFKLFEFFGFGGLRPDVITDTQADYIGYFGFFILWVSSAIFLLGLVLLYRDYRKDAGYMKRISVERLLFVQTAILPLSVLLFFLSRVVFKLPTIGETILSFLGPFGIYAPGFLQSVVMGLGIPLPFTTVIALAIFVLTSILFHLYLLVKLWGAIDDGKSFATSGKAVGLHFIPIFGIIWAVIVWVKFPGEYNKYIERNNLDVKPLSSVLFIIYGLLNIIPFAGFLILPLVLRQGLNATNNLYRLAGKAVSKSSATQPTPVLKTSEI